MRFLERYMERTAKLAKEGGIAYVFKIVGLLPKQDGRYVKDFTDLESMKLKKD